ncbi:MAG TPA: hypothetical protein VHU18_11210 [Rhizomicrobium sp.]|nr:hypothetical protein [Rhizomicrobium sp.]
MQAVFTSSRPGEYQLRPSPGGILAERNFKRYLVVALLEGVEHWQISYRQDGDAVMAQADLFEVPGPGVPATYGGVLRPDSPQTYQLLWDRIAYVLGQRPDWVSCDEYRASLARHSLDGGQEYGLCGEFADGSAPSKLH